MTEEDLPKYKIVENEIIQRINDGLFIDQIPGERSLAELFGCSYMTARKAVNNLVTQGWLYKIPTKGTFVQAKNDKAKTAIIGYFLDKRIQSGISSPYYSMIYNAIVKEAAAHEHTVIYFSDSDCDRLNRVLDKIDGVIATCFPHNEDIIKLMKKKLPLVVIDNPSHDKTIPSVVIDNFTADYNTVKYLYELGHKTIGFMSGLHDSDVGKARLNGYRQGLIDMGLAYDLSLTFFGNYSFESGIKGADYFLSLDEMPQAIICANDSMALGAIQKLKASGIKIPEDISIIGFDDIQFASQVSPALTTVAAPIDEVAHESFTMLQKLIEGKPLIFQHISLSTRLISRGTCQKRK